MTLCASSLRRLHFPVHRTAALLAPMALLLLLAPPAAKAASSTWIAGNGDWNSEVNWNNGIPTTSGSAVISNGSTVSIPSLVTAEYHRLSVGSTAGEAGAINVDGGLFSGVYAYLGDTTEGAGTNGGSGSATVTSGTWENRSFLYVAYSGTGTLTVDGGTVINLYGYVGNDSDSLGSVVVTSGTWENTELLQIGMQGTGTLDVNGGTVIVRGSTITGVLATGNGTITLSGDEDHRGVLETMTIEKGADADAIGTGKVSFNGGIVRALADTNDFFLRYEAGDITLNSGGAFVDTNEFAISINAPLSGGGALHKIGLGTLTLGGINTHTGGTIVEAGTLTTSHEQALGTGAVTVKSGGTFAIQTGVTVANTVMLEGGTLSQTVATETSLEGAANVSTTLGGATSAQLLDGTTSEITTLQASFAATSSAENDEVRLGGVLHLSGVHVINLLTGETDQFVLQLQVAGVSDTTLLGWLDTQTNQWVNAVEGNIGGTTNFLGDKAYNAATDFQLGNYGVDTVNGTVWAVLNHNSAFTVVSEAVPEPGTWALLALGACAVLHHARKRRKMQ